MLKEQTWANSYLSKSLFPLLHVLSGRFFSPSLDMSFCATTSAAKNKFGTEIWIVKIKTWRREMTIFSLLRLSSLCWVYSVVFQSTTEPVGCQQEYPELLSLVTALHHWLDPSGFLQRLQQQHQQSCQSCLWFVSMLPHEGPSEKSVLSLDKNVSGKHQAL